MPTPSLGFCGTGRGEDVGVGPRSEEPATGRAPMVPRCLQSLPRGQGLSGFYSVGRRALVGEDAVDARWTCSAGATVKASMRSASRSLTTARSTGPETEHAHTAEGSWSDTVTDVEKNRGNGGRELPTEDRGGGERRRKRRRAGKEQRVRGENAWKQQGLGRAAGERCEGQEPGVRQGCCRSGRPKGKAAAIERGGSGG